MDNAIKSVREVSKKGNTSAVSTESSLPYRVSFCFLISAFQDFNFPLVSCTNKSMNESIEQIR